MMALGKEWRSTVKRTLCCAGFVLALLCLGVLATQGGATDTLDFSGNYSAQTARGGSNGATISVIQRDDHIEITEVEGGKSLTNGYSLNGVEGAYTGPSGALGKGKAYFKGKSLIVENTVAGRAQPSAPMMRFHTREQWSLSSDLKILTVKTTRDSPDVAPEVSSAIFESLNTTVKYQRNLP
jgi:hypothetical protein